MKNSIFMKKKLTDYKKIIKKMKISMTMALLLDRWSKSIKF